LVRRMSAVSLGRMKAESSLEILRSMRDIESTQSAVGSACAWSVHAMTGEAMPPVVPFVDWETGWFLMPTSSD